ncbi:hypothetical protein [Poseidonibacter ostreae]|uniref:Uncharacterized protein n=1 Tax=Poseidonibacter ostreae TaxID=2654171 RepID=A0A6L4WTL0_9BACT|nr:hypothetical protein [Poseidonibacter ostreae]KAB7885504.1 hypothetical protein GA417_08125 [Poseidonibacter ostreae]KAB7888517.1 hypothetical protein GBG19_09025 [Poseidonibacter ostreae]KAB7890716.1 hypothetical protein GBG18_08245 [Poseidonibacter ostreae]
MQRDKQIEQIFDSIRKVAFYVGHGKYNDYMTTDEVFKIKATLEKILESEKEYEEANTDKEKELIYEKIAVFKTFTVKDFINFDI